VTPLDPTSIVVSDTSILINLCHTGHFGLLGNTRGFRFVVPDEVIAEMTNADQRNLFETALSQDLLARESISSPDELEIYADLSQILGSGESACLALAAKRGWLVACDEKKVFLREARARLGDGRTLNTAGLYVLWIRQGLLEFDEADAAKQILAACRFRLAFKSFRDVI
jgi:predicted nucleic acid-binding protein